MSNESSTEYYKKLFQLQDHVLEIIDGLGLNFYLTGGTALSRFHLNHRFSDDLDFSRQEPKDTADLWFICKNLRFKWEEIIAEAAQKRLMEEIFLVECLRKFQFETLSAIKWIKPLNIEDFKNDVETIIEDIITRSENRLFNLKERNPVVSPG